MSYFIFERVQIKMAWHKIKDLDYINYLLGDDDISDPKQKKLAESKRKLFLERMSRVTMNNDLPEKKSAPAAKPRSLFASDVPMTDSEKMKRKLFDDDSKIAVKVTTVAKPIFETKVLEKVMKDGTSQEYYRTHPLLVGKPSEYIKKVCELDQSTNLDSASRVVNYASGVQKRIGDLLTEISTLSNKIVALGLSENIEIIVNTLRKLDLKNFNNKEVFGLLWNKSVPCTMSDYIAAYEDVDKNIDSLVSKIRGSIQNAYPFIEKSERQLESQTEISEDLEIHVLTGRLILDRTAKKLFLSQSDKFMMEQFEKRICDLSAFEAYVTIALEQSKMTQRNVVTQVMEAFSIIDATLPLWRSSFSILMAKWQNAGSSKDTPLKSLNDSQLAKAASDNTSLIEKIQGKINGTVPVLPTDTSSRPAGRDIGPL